MLNWAQQFNIFCFLDSQHYAITPHAYDCLLGVGAAAFLQGGFDAFQKIDSFLTKNSWTFGHLSYELLHGLYKIKTAKKEAIGFPLFYFFKPQVVLYIRQNTLHIEA